MIRRLIFRIRCYRFTHNGYSEITGEFGKYYAKRGSNVILFVPENENCWNLHQIGTGTEW